MSEAIDGPIPAPTAGERARTLAYGVADGVLSVPGVPYASVLAHKADSEGRPLLLVPAGSPAVASLRATPAVDGDDVPATLRIADVAPVPLADRVRGRAVLHGWVSEVPEDERRAAALCVSRLHPRPELLDVAAGERSWTILRMEIAQVRVEDAWGAATVEAEEYAAARPDPFVAMEGGMLAHLDACHRPELVAMLRRLNGVRRRGEGDEPVVRPVSLDRYGMWVRCGGADLRVVFARPVSDLHGLRCAYRRLFAENPGELPVISRMSE